MRHTPFRTLLVGVGRIGGQYAFDATMARTVPYATHAQVLRDHPDFDWVAAVDPTAEGQSAARRLGARLVAPTLKEVPQNERFDVVAIAAPPEGRMAVVEADLQARAFVVEKPLGENLDQARSFVAECDRRGVLVQVNLTRRADPVMQDLANAGLKRLIGRAQAVAGVYGNGVLNNGIHMVDLCRMLFGEVLAVEALDCISAFKEGPLAADINVPFAMWMHSGPRVMFQPLRFAHYRECAVDIWGETGRVQIVQEGLVTIAHEKAPCRSLHGGHEVVSDAQRVHATGFGRALYDLYGNLADALRGASDLVSPGHSALRSQAVVEAVRKSVERNGARVELYRSDAPAGWLVGSAATPPQ